VLHCVAVCCSVLQCVAVCCSVLQSGAVCWSLLQCDALYCSVYSQRFWWLSRIVAVCCIVVQCGAVYCSVIQCGAVFIVNVFWWLSRIVAVCCIVVQFVTVCCSVVQCGAVCCSVYSQCFLMTFEKICSVLQCVALSCSVVQCVAVYCSVLQCIAVCIGSVLWWLSRIVAVFCSMLQIGVWDLFPDRLRVIAIKILANNVSAQLKYEYVQTITTLQNTHLCIFSQSYVSDIWSTHGCHVDTHTQDQCGFFDVFWFYRYW